MRYETLTVISELLNAEAERRKGELDILRKHLCDAREKLDVAPKDAELQKKVEFAQNFYDRVREKCTQLERAKSDFESHDFR